MRKFCIVYLLLLCSTQIFSQSQTYQLDQPYVPPGANAAGIIREATVQVGYYTGIPNISIPLGSVPGRDIAVPISLQYTASGIKVQDVAGSAGLGWNLSAGGAITRMVRGLPDGSKPYCEEGANMSYYNNSFGHCDGERDIFYFSMLGRSGQLFLDDNGIPRTMPYQDLDILPGVGPASVGYWVITDENGYKYYFGEATGNREEITYYVGNSVSGYTEKETYISTWYLTRILSPNGLQVATFTYAQGSDYEYEMYHDFGIDPPGSAQITVTAKNTKIKVKQAKYLSSITTSVASANFFYLNTREDLPGSRQLSSISLNDQNGIVKERFYLDLDYFTALFGNSIRLRLKGVKTGVFTPVTTYAFTYFDPPPSGNPSRDNPNFDHFGFFNGNCNASYRIAISSYCNPPSHPTKEPGNLSYRQVFLLSDMQTNTGGKTTFQYEDNNGRGVRIKSISNFNGTELVGRSTFSYAGPLLYGTPIYNYTETNSDDEIWTSSSFRDLFDLAGNTVGYNTVTETFLDGSKIVREFHNTDYPDEAPLCKKYKQYMPPSNTPQYQNDISSNVPPFPARTTRFWMRGLLREQRTYDSQNNLLKRDVMTYGEGNSVATVANNAVVLTGLISGNWATYHVGKYYFHSKPVWLTAVESYTYSQANYTDYVVERTAYTYHNTYKTFPSSISRQVGQGPEEKITFRFPVDLTGNGTQPANPSALAEGIWSLYKNHIIKPVEKINWYRDWNSGETTWLITWAELMSFNRNSLLDRPLPVSSYSLVISEPITGLNPVASLTNNGTEFSFDSRYRLLESYSFNNSSATLASLQDPNGITTAYQWFNNTLPSSVIVNPGTGQFKKDYTYNSITGTTRITDENGRNTNYEYDNDFGRLLRVRDHDNNILTRYRYHIKDEPETLKNYQIIHSCTMTNNPITFSCYENTEYGTTYYQWEFGDGSNAITTGDVNHTYSTRGTYQVKLRKENAEYYSLNTSATITVYNAITGFTGMITGPSTYDVCSNVPPTEPTWLVATVAGDALSYAWEYSFNGGWWWSMGSGTGPIRNIVSSPPPDFGYPSSIVGTWQVRCTVTDACGNAFVTYFTLTNFASDPMCPIN
jgi:YD repeat-containing protein